MSDVVTEPVGAEPGDADLRPDLGWALAGMSAAAGVIHFAMTPLHAAAGWQEPLAFVAAGWFQLITAAIVLAGRANKRTYQAIVAANAAFIGVWLWSRTMGLPVGENPGAAEPVGAVDAVAVLLQTGVVLVGLRLLLAPTTRSAARLAPALVAVAALGLATAVMVSPDAADHGHSDELTGLAALEAEIADDRCDLEFNMPAYWQEAATLGVDTTFGNNPPAVEGEDTGGGHHGAGTADTTETTEPDPNDGRGSPGLDALVSATGLAATSEVEAANLITALSDSDQADYDAWLWWLTTSGSLEHEHSATVTSEDGSGHGGHVGPQPWVAMTDQAECDRLADELDEARDVALAHPTAADAVAAGYELTTGYLPGIAAHYIRYDLIDEQFEVDQPEMILYDGSSPEARVVGLSYYLWHAGDNKPTQGFTGDNDHPHRHQGLCSNADGVIIGDTTTSDEECEARGGTKGDGSKGWMSHAWVVPGCESPWGVFSAASPVLDDDLGDASTTDGGSCAGSGVRERYGMGAAPEAPSVPRPAQAPETTGN